MVLKEFEEAHKLPELEGSVKQVKWARDIRRDFVVQLEKIFEKYVRPKMPEFGKFFDTFEPEYLSTFTTAKFWIDNRDKFDEFKAELFRTALDKGGFELPKN